MKIFTILLFLIIFQSTIAQETLRFGEWEDHLPYQRGLAITQSNQKVYYATDFSIMTVDKADFSLEFISKVDGLSTLGISDLKYDKFTNQILVIYNDSNIDILSEDGIINIADIKNNTGIFGDKRINDVSFKSGIAYFSIGFGVVSFNMETYEFGFTTQMGLQVFSSTVNDDNMLFAATEDGIYTLDLNRNYNFSDFGNWGYVGSEYGLPEIYTCSAIGFYQDHIIAVIDDQLYRYEGTGDFELLYSKVQGEELMFINDEGSKLMVGIRTPSSFSSRVLYFDMNFELNEGTSSCANFIYDALEDESGRIWYADDWNSFRYTDGINGECHRFTAPSPASHTVGNLSLEGGVLYAACGGVTEGFQFQSNRNGIYVLDKGQWINFNESTYQPMKDADMINSYIVAPNPSGNEVFIGSFYGGLLKTNLNTGESTHYNSQNSPILGPQGTPDLERISGLTYDSNGNLWISAYQAEKPLIALTPEGTFHAFSVPSSANLSQIIEDDFGNLWIQVAGASGGILIFNYGQNVNDPSDDQFRFVNTSNSNMLSNIVNCLAKNKNGDIWVGTSSGPIIFECGDPFSLNSDRTNYNCIGSSFGSIRIVLEDSIPAQLLVTEDVRSIEIDGGNNVWIGSRNGIFVQTPSGNDNILRFTSENSALFDNNIIDMAFDGNSGVMYIASDFGIQAYKTETTDGGRFHQSTAYAFPNPVRPEYDGPIAFRGLAMDANIKITDIRGQLVFETKASGGQALWNGKDYNGREVASGVYLVFSTNSDSFDDPNNAVLKVLMIR